MRVTTIYDFQPRSRTLLPVATHRLVLSLLAKSLGLTAIPHPSLNYLIVSDHLLYFPAMLVITFRVFLLSQYS